MPRSTLWSRTWPPIFRVSNRPTKPAVCISVNLRSNLPSDICVPAAISLVKVFQGAGLPEFQRAIGPHFAKVYVRKPKSSRDRSRETFLVGKGFAA